MTKVHFVKSAAKDYPQTGIKKGEPYYWWQHYRQPKQMSKQHPKPSQVASSEYARSVLALIERLEGWGEESWTESDRDDLVSELEQIRDEEQDKFDNMPEGFQQGDTGVMIEERIAALDDWISELGGIEFLDLEDDSFSETPLEQALSSAIAV